MRVRKQFVMFLLVFVFLCALTAAGLSAVSAATIEPHKIIDKSAEDVSGNYWLVGNWWVEANGGTNMTTALDQYGRMKVDVNIFSNADKLNKISVQVKGDNGHLTYVFEDLSLSNGANTLYVNIAEMTVADAATDLSLLKVNQAEVVLFTSAETTAPLAVSMQIYFVEAERAPVLPHKIIDKSAEDVSSNYWLVGSWWVENNGGTNMTTALNQYEKMKVDINIFSNADKMDKISVQVKGDNGHLSYVFENLDLTDGANTLYVNIAYMTVVDAATDLSLLKVNQAEVVLFTTAESTAPLAVSMQIYFVGEEIIDPGEEGDLTLPVNEEAVDADTAEFSSESTVKLFDFNVKNGVKAEINESKNITGVWNTLGNQLGTSGAATIYAVAEGEFIAAEGQFYKNGGSAPQNTFNNFDTLQIIYYVENYQAIESLLVTLWNDSDKTGTYVYASIKPSKNGWQTANILLTDLYAPMSSDIFVTSRYSSVNRPNLLINIGDVKITFNGQAATETPSAVKLDDVNLLTLYTEKTGDFKLLDFSYKGATTYDEESDTYVETTNSGKLTGQFAKDKGENGDGALTIVSLTGGRDQYWATTGGLIKDHRPTELGQYELIKLSNYGSIELRFFVSNHAIIENMLITLGVGSTATDGNPRAYRALTTFTQNGWQSLRFNIDTMSGMSGFSFEEDKAIVSIEFVITFGDSTVAGDKLIIDDLYLRTAKAEPSVTINENMPSSGETGTEIDLSGTYIVTHPYETDTVAVNVSVMFNGTNVVTLTDGKFTPTKAGTYTVKIIATDSMSAQVMKTAEIIVTGEDIDSEPPVISTINVVKLYANPGEIDLSKISVTDDTDASPTLSIRVTNEAGDVEYTVTDSKFSVTQPGKYKVYVTATDAANHVAEASFTINVSGTAIEEPEEPSKNGCGSANTAAFMIAAATLLMFKLKRN